MDELNRDLLVAVLALLTDAIPRPGLAAVLKSWSQDRQQPLAQLLKQAATLDDDHIHALQCLAAAHLKMHNNDLRQSVDAWNASEVTQDVLTEIIDDTLRTTLSSTLGPSVTIPADPDSQGVLVVPGSPQASGATLGERFQLIRPHARGGIGQVWVARDSELQRDVALKEIQPRYAERADQRARFVLEAEITGNLEHPGIVPVYSLGRNAEGRPYYAMRFIRGESFAVAIRQFHKSFRDEADAAVTKSRPQTKWGIAFRQLLGRFLDVCDAIDYAHSRNVLHRDLKPANIMLGRFGETLVVDWGLAKVIGKNEVIPQQGDGEFEPGLSGASVTASGETQQGTTIGTPAYMSPEQARGSIDQLGPASDVYSLGATLYELLTGQVAFPGEKISAVLEKVRKGDFPAPRAVDRSIPTSLEAICLKAMAIESDARYSSVRAVAQDIEHWLADEPVAAYPERRLERLGRWIRQHRTWTYAAAAALVGVSLAATIAVVVIEAARRGEEVARKEAETNFDLAQKSVEDYLTSISENTLLKLQDSVDIRSLRQELLNNALKYYKSFVSQRSHDPLLRRQLAENYFRVGDITQEIASPLQAIEAFRSAQAIWEPLVAADPGDHKLQSRLADCYLATGKVQNTIGNLEHGMKSLTQARAILESLAAGDPVEARYQSSLAECYTEIGIIQAKLDQSGQSLVILEKAKAIQKGLIERFPDKLIYQKTLAAIINVLGFAYFKQHDNAAALDSFQEVQRTCLDIVKQVTIGPKPLWLLNLLALAQYNIASIHKQNGDNEKALQSYEQSLPSLTALVASHSSVNEYQEKLGDTYREIAHVQHESHKDAEALRSIQRSVEVFQGLVKSQPDQASYHSALALSWNRKGYYYDVARKNAEAISPFQQAVHEQQLAVDKSKDVDDYKLGLCYYLDNLGEQYVDLGHVADGLPHFLRALEIRRALSAAHEQDRMYALEVVKSLINLGTIRRHDGDSDAACVRFTEAGTIVERWRRAKPDDAALQVKLAEVLDQEANTLVDLGQPEEAQGRLERAVELSRPKPNRATSEPDGIQERQWYSEALWDLARVLRARELPEQAEKADAERAVLWDRQPSGELVELAITQLKRATVIGYGMSPSPISDSAKSVRELDLEQAAANLRLAISRGFNDLRMFQSDPDSAFLLSREDLKSSLKALQSPDQPSPAPPLK